MSYSTNRRSPTGFGRPRDEGATERIFEAVFFLFAERGYSGTTIGAVAARAGVGTKTIYRRSANRDEMILASLESGLAMPAFDNTGDTFQDLLAMLEPGGREHTARKRLQLGSAIALEARRHPEFLMEFRRQFIWPLRRSLIMVLERGARRGEIRDDADLEVVVDLLLGAATSRYWSGEDFGKEYSASALRLALAGCMRPSVNGDLDRWVGAVG